MLSRLSSKQLLCLAVDHLHTKTYMSICLSVDLFVLLVVVVVVVVVV